MVRLINNVLVFSWSVSGDRTTLPLQQRLCRELLTNVYHRLPWNSQESVPDFKFSLEKSRIGIFESVSKLMILDFLVLPSKFEGSWDKMDKLILIVHVIYRLKSMLMCHDMANEITFLNYLCYTVQLMLLCHDITNEITYSYRQVNYKLDESINWSACSEIIYLFIFNFMGDCSLFSLKFILSFWS